MERIRFVRRIERRLEQARLVRRKQWRLAAVPLVASQTQREQRRFVRRVGIFGRFVRWFERRLEP
jgi:hypothetical protein